MNAEELFAGEGEMAALTRSRDWASTSLGPVRLWPSFLRAMVQTLLRSRHPMFLFWGPELVQFYNDAYRPSLGPEKHPRVLGQPGRACWPELWHLIGPQIDDAMKHGKASWNEDQLVPFLRNGRVDEVYWTYSYNPAFDDAGKVGGVLVVCTETTKRVLGERELRKSEERLRGVAEASGTGTWEIDLATMHVTADERFTSLFGLEHQASLSLETFTQQVHPADRDRIHDVIAAAIQGEHGGTYLAEHRTIHPGDGSERWVEARGQVSFDAAGKAVRFLGTGVDVTQRRKAEAERAASLERVSHVIESMGDAFFALDAQWRVRLVNENLERVTGMKRDDILGGSFWEMFQGASDPGSQYWMQYQRCHAERIPVKFVDYYKALDLWTDVRAYPTDDGGIAVFFRDISAEKRAEAVEKSRADFEQQLIGIVSHDLRAPLQSILFSTTALAQQEALEASAARSVLRIQASAERATRMIRDLLDFTQARLGSGIRIHPQHQDLEALVRTVVEELTATHPSRNIQLQVEGNLVGAWDGDRIAQVVTNLLSNALDYSPGETSVRVELRGEPDQVALAFQNDGPPIPPGKLAEIFEPLQRATSEVVGHGKRSVGLGLYIVKHIVEAHGGSVEVRSSLAEGTRFTVHLPRARPAS